MKTAWMVRLMCAMLLGLSTAACTAWGIRPVPTFGVTAVQESATATPTPAPSATLTSTPTPSPTPEPTATAVQNYQLTAYNRYPWEVHMFMDGDYLMAIPPIGSAVFPGIPVGTHAFQHCQDKDMRTCDAPAIVTVAGDILWVASPVSGALSTFPAGAVQTQPANVTNRFQITIHNRYPWKVYVFMDDDYHGAIPASTSMVFTGIVSGEHTFKFCKLKSMRDCLTTKVVNMTGDTTLTIGA